MGEEPVGGDNPEMVRILIDHRECRTEPAS
jgi:hypothetical protein